MRLRSKPRFPFIRWRAAFSSRAAIAFALWSVLLLSLYWLGFTLAMDATRAAVAAKDAAAAELPRNSLLWDRPPWTQVAERMHAADRSAGGLESILQFWLPALLALGVGAVGATLLPIPSVKASTKPSDVQMRSLRREHSFARVLAVLSMAFASLAASEFLARWRPDWLVPPLWGSWLQSLTPSISLWVRAALPLALAGAMAVLGIRTFRRARHLEELLRTHPSQLRPTHRPDDRSDEVACAGQPSRTQLQAITLRLRTLGVMAIALAAAFPATNVLWAFRGAVPDGRFLADELELDPESHPLHAVGPLLYLVALPPLAVGSVLVIVAPRLAGFPWRRRERAHQGRCQRCGVFLEACAEHCWDCGEVVRCTKCDHALRTDQDHCPECGSGRGGRRAP
jgi:hypothetical protein